MENKMIRVKGPADVPEGEHYAVIIYKVESVHIPGDERSRQCPGHGYGERTEKYDTFEHWVTTDFSELEKFLQVLEAKDFSRAAGYESYVFFRVSGKGRLTRRVEFDIHIA